MSGIAYQNPTTTNFILDSADMGGSPDVRREIIVIGDPTNPARLAGVDVSGNLLVNVAAGSTGNSAASATGSAVPASAGYTGINIAGNLVGITGFSLTNSKAAAIAIVDGSGNQITSFGGGTQFADNAASGATPTGTLSMGWDSANSKVRGLKVDASQNLNVNVQAATLGTVTVSGTVAVTNFANPLPVSQSGNWTARVVGNAGALIDAATGAAVPANAIYLGANKAGNITGLSLDGSGNLNVNLNANSFGTVSVSGTVSVTNFANPLLVSQSGTWNTRTQDGAGNALTTNSITTASKFALDQNIISILGTAPTTAGFLDVKGADGNVFVRQATAANLNATVVFPSAQAVTLTSTTVTGAVAVTQSTSPWVDNISQFGGVNISTGTGVGGTGIPRVTVSSDSFPATQPVSGTITVGNPSTNYSLESGGNLATITTQTRNDAQIGDLLNYIIRHLQLLNINVASSIPGADSTIDVIDGAI